MPQGALVERLETPEKACDDAFAAPRVFSFARRVEAPYLCAPAMPIFDCPQDQGGTVASTYPYTNSVGGLISTLHKLRKVFPPSVTTKTLAQWGFAPKNERYVIGVLKYLGVIDEDGKKSPEASKVFSHHNDADFEEAFSKIVRERYSGLFEIHGDDTWTCDQDDLVSFFRHEDETSATVGARQARTFQALADTAGTRGTEALPSPSKSTPGPKKPAVPKKKKKTTTMPVPEAPVPSDTRAVGLTVRIELNLPATTDQKVYDGIFKSVRKYLIDD